MVTHHRNVYITLFTSFLFSMRFSLWMLVDAYVLFLPQPYGSASKVGIMEGASGLVAFCSMIVAGVLTDRIGRIPALYLCGFGYQLTGITIAIAVLYLPSRSSTQAVFLTLCLATGIAGFNQGLFFTASSALLADSTAQNSRNKFYLWKQAAISGGLAFGPLVACGCFALTHNSWTTPELTIVCMVAAALGVPLGLSMFLFREVRTLSRGGSEGLLASTPSDEPLPVTPAMRNDAIEGGVAAAEGAGASINAATAGPGEAMLDTAADDGASAPIPAKSCLYHSVAPLIALCDLFTGMGSGIIYKFVPLFLLHDLQLKPIAVQAIIIGMAGSATVLSLTAAPVQRLLGPMGATVFYRMLAVACLSTVTFSVELGAPDWLICTCCVVRGAFMNAVGGITEAVLMDHTSEAHRGKWQIAQRISDSTWSGAAVVGGFLVDRIGYRKAFVLPTLFHFIGTLCLLPIVATVKADKKEGGR